MCKDSRLSSAGYAHRGVLKCEATPTSPLTNDSLASRLVETSPYTVKTADHVINSARIAGEVECKVMLAHNGSQKIHAKQRIL